jgi:predicted permease
LPKARRETGYQLKGRFLQHEITLCANAGSAGPQYRTRDFHRRQFDARVPLRGDAASECDRLKLDAHIRGIYCARPRERVPDRHNSMLARILAIVFPLFAIAALGYLVGRRTRPNLEDANKLNMDVFLPALVFGALASKDFRVSEYATLALVTFAVVVGSGLLGWAIARALGIAGKTFVPAMMFNNCGNLGLPLAVLAFGEEALAPAVVMFMVSNFLHFSFGAWLLNRDTRLVTIWRVPSVLATILGLAVSAAGVELWAPLMQAIKMLGDVSIPLLLFALGVRLADARYPSWRIGAIAAVARPLIG